MVKSTAIKYLKNDGNLFIIDLGAILLVFEFPVLHWPSDQMTNGLKTIHFENLIEKTNGCQLKRSRRNATVLIDENNAMSHYNVTTLFKFHNGLYSQSDYRYCPFVEIEKQKGNNTTKTHVSLRFQQNTRCFIVFHLLFLSLI